MNVKDLRKQISGLRDDCEVVMFVGKKGYRATNAGISKNVHKNRIGYVKGQSETRPRLVIES